MKKNSYAQGRFGEESARSYLEKRGWNVIDRNWRSAGGEIDLVAIEGDTLVFIEVKYFPHTPEIDLRVAVNSAKQKRIIESSKYFLDFHREYNCLYVRYDVILVGNGGNIVQHIRAAFSETV